MSFDRRTDRQSEMITLYTVVGDYIITKKTFLN